MFRIYRVFIVHASEIVKNVHLAATSRCWSTRASFSHSSRTIRRANSRAFKNPLCEFLRRYFSPQARIVCVLSQRALRRSQKRRSIRRRDFHSGSFSSLSLRMINGSCVRECFRYVYRRLRERWISMSYEMRCSAVSARRILLSL